MTQKYTFTTDFTDRITIAAALVAEAKLQLDIAQSESAPNGTASYKIGSVLGTLKGTDDLFAFDERG